MLGFLLLPLMPSLWTVLQHAWHPAKWELLTSPPYLTSSINSMLIGGLVALCTGAIGTLHAFLLERVRLPGRALWQHLYLLPLLVPPYVQTIGWMHLVDQSSVLASFSSPDQLMRLHALLFSRFGVVAILTCIYAPLVSAVVQAGLRSMDRQAEEVALFTASPARVCLRVTLPLILPHILSSALVVFILAVNTFDVPDLLRVRVVPIEIFLQLSVFYDEAGALMMAFPLLLLAGISAILIQRVIGSKGFAFATLRSNGQPLFTGRGVEFAGGVFCALLFLIALVAPVAMLLHSAAASQNLQFAKILSGSLGQIRYSAILALCSAALASLAAFPVGYLLARQRQAGPSGIQLLLLLLFALPVVFYSLGLVKILNHPWVNALAFTSLPCIAGLAAHFLCIGVIVLQIGLLQIHPTSEEYGLFTSKSPLRSFTGILVPQLIPFFAVVFVIVFLFVFSELSATLLLVPPGEETVAVKIYNLLHYGVQDAVACLSLLIALAICTLFFMLQGWLRWMAQPR